MMQIVDYHNSKERIWLAKYRLNKSPRQGRDFSKTLLKKQRQGETEKRDSLRNRREESKDSDG